MRRCAGWFPGAGAVPPRPGAGDGRTATSRMKTPRATASASAKPPAPAAEPAAGRPKALLPKSGGGSASEGTARAARRKRPIAARAPPE